MKRKVLSGALAMLLLFTTVTTPSCIGSFTLTNRLLGWNQHLDNKIINEVVFFAFWILPVYEITALADVLVLNSIEFWSGTNPMAKSKKIIEGNDGRYLVKCDGKGYDIVSLNDNSKVRLDFNADTQTWSYTTNGESHDFLTFIDETHISVPAGTGNNWQTVEISQDGLYAYRQMITNACFATR